MKILLRILLFFPICISAQLSNTQKVYIDSLKDVVRIAKHDTLVVEAWRLWDNVIYLSDPKLDLELNENIVKLCEENLKKTLSTEEKSYFLKCEGISLNNFGLIYTDRGEYDKAKDFFLKSIEVKKRSKDRSGVANSINNIGNIYAGQGDYQEAIKYYEKSLKLREEIKTPEGNLMDIKGVSNALVNLGVVCKVQGDYASAIRYYTRALVVYEGVDDKHGQSSVFINIGTLYKQQKEDSKAITYYEKSLKLSKEIDDKKLIATSLSDIGSVHRNAKKYEKAIKYFEESLLIRTEIKDNHGTAQVYNHLGSIYLERDNLEKAYEYFFRTLELMEKVGSKNGIAAAKVNLGIIYFDKGQYLKSIIYSKDALSLAKEMNVKSRIKDASSLLWKNFEKIHDYKEAFYMLKLYTSTNDSLNSESNKNEVIRHEFKYLYDKKAIADSIEAIEREKVSAALIKAERAEVKSQKQFSYFLYGIIGLVILFGGFIFNRFKVTSKQKDIIEEQKHQVDEAFEELEEKNNEIMDSITYAKRIQSAILPPKKLVKEYLKESFILYLPKDIVAGDFYWMEHKDDKVLFAAADCTGHGVPGAMVSVICNNGLNRSVREYGLTDPGKILDKTREIVIQEFEKSEEDVKDGMDIALCSLSTLTKKISYAGAYNPLWIIRNGEIIEIKGDKQPIGKFERQSSFTTHTFDLFEGDTVYIFSDGYVDQFGGGKGKKLKAKAFREILLSVQSLNMEEQRKVIDERFSVWKGDLEQVDDVCVIGVRI